MQPGEIEISRIGPREGGRVLLADNLGGQRRWGAAGEGCEHLVAQGDEAFLDVRIAHQLGMRELPYGLETAALGDQPIRLGQQESGYGHLPTARHSVHLAG